MRVDNYDSAVFKYGIISFKDNTNERITDIIKGKDSEACRIVSAAPIVDFNQVDGLTIEEIASYPKLICDNCIFFVMYDQIDSQSQTKKIRHIVIIDKNDCPVDQPIDETIVDYIDNHYREFNNSERMRANGFLQRYKYGTHEATNEHVQYLINKR